MDSLEEVGRCFRLLTLSGDTFVKAKSQLSIPECSGSNGDANPLASLEEYRRIKAPSFIRLLAVGRSSFYSGLREGRYPLPDGYDGAKPYWHLRTVSNCLQGGDAGGKNE